MKNKLICTLISIIILSMTMMSCGTTDSTSSSTTSAPDTNTTAAPDANTTAAPSTSEAAKLTVEVFDRGNAGGSDPTNNVWTTWIHDKVLADINVDVSFVSVPRSEEIPQLNVLMAAKTAPDICFTYDTGVVYNFYQQGGLADLTPYMAEYGQTLSSYLGEDILKYGQYDGKQIAIPAQRLSQARLGTYIRKDWLDALGLPIPKTTEEFYDALVQFKEKNPGNVPTVVPLTATYDIAWRTGALLESFIDPTLSDRDLYRYSVGDMSILLPGWKDGVKFLNKLYNEGLLDPEFALYKDDTTSDDLTMAGSVGAYIHNFDNVLRPSPGILTTLKQNVPEAEFVPVNCFQNSAGEVFNIQYNPTGIRLIVPSFSKNAEAAVKYLNWMAEQENRYYLQTGVEGVNHTLNADGNPVIQVVEGEYIMNSPNNIDYVNIVNGLDSGNPEKNLEIMSLSYPGAEDLFMEAYNLAITGSKVVPPFQPAPVPLDSSHASELKEKTFEIYAKTITCTPDQFDATWEAAIAEYMQMGAEESFNERTELWDASN